jgi:predicted 2-oxoglutarate/Fe(II)-dependent dioxygenase YbiX
LYSIGLTDEAVGLAGHPDTYNGGALVIEDTLESRSVKLRAGDLILYPSTSVHRVDLVARGERLALVGWATSWVRRRIIGKSSLIWSAAYSIWRHAAAQPRLLNC